MNREFATASQAFDVLAEDSSRWPRGTSRVGNVREDLGVQLVITDPCRGVVVNPRRKLDPHYLGAELLWYLSHRADVAWLTPYAPSYSRFADPKTGDAHGAYGKRLELTHSYDQIDAVCELLTASPDTRQAVVTIWRPGDLLLAVEGHCPDIPCTVAWQFLLRDGELWMIVTMRSNDLWLGFPYDVACFTFIQQLVAARLGVTPGLYVHQVGSLHAYDTNRVALDEAVAEFYGEPIAAHHESTMIDVEYASMLNTAMAAVEARDPLLDQSSSILLDAARCCVAKFKPEVAATVRHPSFKRLLENRRGG